MAGVSDGLIPAHTGNTLRVRGYAKINQAHPHTRGENLASAASGLVGMGSFPHTRGPSVTSPSVRSHMGLLPAYAGTTLVCRCAHDDQHRLIPTGAG